MTENPTLEERIAELEARISQQEDCLTALSRLSAICFCWAQNETEPHKWQTRVDKAVETILAATFLDTEPKVRDFLLEHLIDVQTYCDLERRNKPSA